MARCMKTVLDQDLQVVVTRTEPRAKSLNFHGCVIAELKLPHGVRNPAFALVESLNDTTKCAVEIKTDLSDRDGVHLNVVVDANISNQHQQVVEDQPYLHSNVFIRVEEIVMAQENRNG